MTKTMTGPQTLDALIQNWFMLSDAHFISVLGDGEQAHELLEALDCIDESIRACIARDIRLVLDNELLLTNERVWRLLYHGEKLVDAMLMQDSVPRLAWSYALKYVPRRRIQVADRLIADGQSRMLHIIARMVPERARLAWEMLWGGPSNPSLNTILSIAKANPMFRAEVAQMLLEGYPRDRISAKSMAWVRRYGEPAQRLEAEAQLERLKADPR